MVYRLRQWQRAIDQGRVQDAIDWLAQCQSLVGARAAAKSLRHPTLCTWAAQSLWDKTKALVARQA